MAERPPSFDLAPPAWHPLAQGLVFAGLGRFTGSTLYYDSSLSGYVGTLTGFAGAGKTPAETWGRANGRPKLGPFVAASEMYVGFNNAVNIQGEMTISTWFKSDDYAATQSIASNLQAVGTDASYHFEFGRTDNKLSWLQNGNTVDATSTGTISDANWHHIGARRRGGTGAWTIDFVIDGVISSHATAYNPVTPLGLLSLGRAGSYPGLYLSGSLSDTMIWSRALSDTEWLSFGEADNVMLSLGGSDLLRYRPSRSRVYFSGAAPAGNRRRRVICGS